MKIVSESLNEIMGFQRGVDPKESMGIGRLSNISSESIKNAFACVRNYSLDDLQNIYKRIRAKSNISLDGVPIENLSRYDWAEFNNKVVNGIKSLKRRITKAKSPFMEGDLLKVIHNGRTYFGVYAGIDKNGRIKAKGNRVKLLFNIEEYTRATPIEEENYRNESIKLEKQTMTSKIQNVQRMIERGFDKGHQFDNILLLRDLIDSYENKFGEKYEG